MTLTELEKLADAVSDIGSLLIPRETDSKSDSIKKARATLEDINKIVARLDNEHNNFDISAPNSNETEINWKELNLANSVKLLLEEAINTAEKE